MIARAAIVSVLAIMGFIAIASSEDADRAACHRDAIQFCRHAIEGGPFTVAACLAANHDKISQECKASLAKHGF